MLCVDSLADVIVHVEAEVEAIPQKDIAIAVISVAASIAAILLQVRNFRNCLS